jgi:hypothetical protein
MPLPAPLAANLPFAFRGEQVDPARRLPPPTAHALFAARNPTGKANADVLREVVGLAPDGTESRRWVVDFPPTMSRGEVALYAAPAAHLTRAGLPPTNPHANPALRASLARLDRFLAAPVDGSGGFAWIEGDVLPDDSLVVWARDDDFSAGVLGSSAFGSWLDRCNGDVLAALRSHPFPWPSATPLSALSREQEEIYFSVARAARRDDPEALDAAVARAYGWPDHPEPTELIARLEARHAARA